MDSLRSYQNFLPVCTLQYQPSLFTAPSTCRIGPLYRPVFSTNNIPIALNTKSIDSSHHSQGFSPLSAEFLDFQI